MRVLRGAVFRGVDRGDKVCNDRLSDKAVARAVKRAARALGLDDTRFSGHSLRAGLATSAATAGASDHAIRRQTGHRSSAMVNRYVREGDPIRQQRRGASRRSSSSATYITLSAPTYISVGRSKPVHMRARP